MYNINKEPFGSLQKFRLSNQETGEYISVIPSYGGNINELVLLRNNTLYSVIFGDKDESSLIKLGGTKFFGAKLSPFPNRIKEGKFNFRGRLYRVEKNEKNRNALHGFLWNKKFDVIMKEADETRAVLTLGYSYKGDISGYPFDYNIKIEYILDKEGFACTTTIKNIWNEAMPLGDGWHPYIKTGSSINNLSLQLPTVRMIMTDKNLIPDGNIEYKGEYLSGKIINDDMFDNCFGPIERAGIAETILYDKEQNLKICVWQGAGKNGYNYIQIYTPEDRASIVIEPMTCAPDAFNSGEGLIVLEPGEETVLKFGIRLL